jgi:hypothetical protein
MEELPRYHVVMLQWARSNRNTWVGWCPLGAALEKILYVAHCSSTHMMHPFELNVSSHTLHHHKQHRVMHEIYVMTETGYSFCLPFELQHYHYFICVSHH